jgi:predicted nucleic acid-binding protein
MIVLDASVALKWFVADEPLVEQALGVLHEIERDPRPYLVPELFMNELLAVLTRLPGATTEDVRQAVALVEALGLSRHANGHELLELAAELACGWRISGYDAVYVALASLGRGVWLTADTRAARMVRARRRSLVRLLAAGSSLQ